jgi:hypothetical protein
MAMLRGCLWIPLVLGALLLAAPAEARSPVLASPALSPTPFPGAHFRDRVIPGTPRAVQAADADAWWGGPITNSNNETFRVYVSRLFPVDEAVRARWANFLGWALHGNEISDVNVYVATLSEVQRTCGQNAYGCYYPAAERLYFPGEQGEDGALNISEILLHEYGHHVAQNRRNDPWPAVDWGAKRWASFEDVCSRASRSQVFPGDEGRRYLLNPGEAFADSYRVLNVRRAERSDPTWYRGWGTPLPFQWTAFSTANSALAAVEQDVLRPWARNKVVRWRGRTPRKGKSFLERYRGERSASRRIFTDLDGTLSFTLDSAPRGSYITVRTSAFRSTSGRRSITTNVCGETSFTLEVTTVVPRGRFRATISHP